MLKNIWLSFFPGAKIGVLGPNGAGKSTILRMIAGLEEITKGEIFIDGKCVNNIHPKDRDIAFVFQNYALYPHMSVYENMAFPLKMRKMKKNEIDAKVKEIAQTKLPDLNCSTVESAMNMVKGQAVSMGIKVVE